MEWNHEFLQVTGYRNHRKAGRRAAQEPAKIYPHDFDYYYDYGTKPAAQLSSQRSAKHARTAPATCCQFFYVVQRIILEIKYFSLRCYTLEFKVMFWDLSLALQASRDNDFIYAPRAVKNSWTTGPNRDSIYSFSSHRSWLSAFSFKREWSDRGWRSSQQNYAGSFVSSVNIIFSCLQYRTYPSPHPMPSLSDYLIFSDTMRGLQERVTNTHKKSAFKSQKELKLVRNIF